MDVETRKIEAWKLEHDFLKHLTTLSTGSIIIIVGLLEKLFTNPEWKALVAISLVSFVTSILGAIFVKIQVILQIYGNIGPSDESGSWIIMVPTLVVFAGFLVGITSFVIFGVVNIL